MEKRDIADKLENRMTRLLKQLEAARNEGASETIIARLEKDLAHVNDQYYRALLEPSFVPTVPVRYVPASIAHDPEKGMYGDCHRACYASILGLDLHNVPHFYENGREDVGFVQQRFWLSQFGFGLMNFGIRADGNKIPLDVMANMVPDAPVIVMGETPFGKEAVGHSVVVHRGEVVMNPSPEAVLYPVRYSFSVLAFVPLPNFATEYKGFGALVENKMEVENE